MNNHTTPRVVVPCSQCGNPVKKYPSALKRTKNSFCSDVCEYAFRSAHAKCKVSLVCPVCGKSFVRFQSYVNDQGEHNGLCCSRECMGIHQRRRVEKTCEECGNGFVTHKSSEDRLFCSRTCYEKNKKAEYITKTCELCAKEFEIKRSVAHRYHVCSLACKGATHKECKRCGKVIYQRPDENRSYCSEECRRPPHYVTCANCNRTFRRTPSEIVSGNNFCDSHCYRAHTGDSSLEMACEATLQEFGIPYQKQVPAGKFTIDFVLPGNVALEADGWYWHQDNTKEQRRDTYLRKHGYKPLHLRWEGYQTIPEIVRDMMIDLLSRHGFIKLIQPVLLRV